MKTFWSFSNSEKPQNSTYGQTYFPGFQLQEKVTKLHGQTPAKNFGSTSTLSSSTFQLLINHTAQQTSKRKMNYFSIIDVFQLFRNHMAKRAF